MIKLLFIGTGDFPIPIFERLIKSKKINTVGLITNKYTQGENRGIIDTAKNSNIPVFTPEQLHLEQEKILAEANPNIILVCNYGQMINEEMLKFPEYGVLNVHGSILPELRGACPIEMSIMKGLKTTGITIQKMVKALDEGDILFQKEVRIDPKETGGSLSNKLQELATNHIKEVITDWVAGKIKPKQQNNTKATYCYRKDISKDAAKIDWRKSAQEIDRKIRAFNPRVIAWTLIRIEKPQKRFKIFEAEVDPDDLGIDPGEVKIENNSLYIQTGKGVLIPKIVQIEGKGEITIQEFIRGIKDPLSFK